MIKKDFIKKMEKTGEVSTEEFTLFLLEHYFAKGYTLDDYQNDLVFKYNFSNSYAEACKESAYDTIKQYIKDRAGNIETWEHEMERRGIEHESKNS